MKRTFRLVWNDALDVWVAIAARRSDPKRRRQGKNMHVLHGVATRTGALGGRTQADAM